MHRRIVVVWLRRGAIQGTRENKRAAEGVRTISRMLDELDMDQNCGKELVDGDLARLKGIGSRWGWDAVVGGL